MLYLVIFVFLSTFGYLSVFYLRKDFVLQCYIFFVLMFFALSFLRWQRGTDWLPYENAFIRARDSASNNFFEIGYSYLNYFVRQLTDDYTWMLFACAMLIFPIKYTACYRLSKLPIMALLACFSLYFCDVFFNRQSIALAIDFFSLIYIIEKKPVKFSALVLLSCLFHKTSILFIFAYRIFYMQITRKKIFIATLVVVLLLSVSSLIMKYAFVYFLSTGNKYSLYFDDNVGPLVIGNPITYIIKSILNRSLLLSLVLLLRKHLFWDKLERGLLNLYLFGLILLVLLSPISLTLVRISYYYFQFEIILIASLCYNKYQKDNRFVVFFIVLIYLLVRLIINVFGAYYELYVPFKFFWENIPVNIF